MTNQQTLTGLITDVADAIRLKAGTSGTMTLAQMPTNISAIPSGDTFNWAPVDYVRWKTAYTGLISLEGMPTSVTDALTNTGSFQFGSCKCSGIDFANHTFPNLNSMNFFISNCQYVTRIDMSGFNTQPLTGLRECFKNCSRLQYLDFSGVKLGTASSTASYDSVFSNCSALKTLIWDRNGTTVKKMGGCTIATIVAGATNANLKIYVPDDLVSAYETAEPSLVGKFLGISQLQS